MIFTRDVAVAAHDIIVGRRRRQYRYELVVQAPKDAVRRLLSASHVAYETGDVRTVTEPLAGVEGVDVTRLFIGDRLYGSISARRTGLKPDSCSWRLLPEHSDLSSQIGDDDTVEVSWEALPDGSTQTR